MDLGTVIGFFLALKKCETRHIFFRPWLASLKPYELSVYWTAFTRKVFAGLCQNLTFPLIQTGAHEFPFTADPGPGDYQTY